MSIFLLSTGCLMLGATLGIFIHCMIIVAKQSEEKSEEKTN